MPRLSRLVVPGYPHHITQRGVRSMEIFADDRNRLSYLQFLNLVTHTVRVTKFQLARIVVPVDEDQVNTIGNKAVTTA